MQILNLADKTFKAAVITTLNDVEENILTMNAKIGNITRGSWIIKEKPKGNS